MKYDQFVLGEMAVLYLYMRYRYNWNEVTFSMWSTYGMVTNLIGKLNDTEIHLIFNIIQVAFRLIPQYYYYNIYEEISKSFIIELLKIKSIIE